MRRVRHRRNKCNVYDSTTHIPINIKKGLWKFIRSIKFHNQNLRGKSTRLYIKSSRTHIEKYSENRRNKLKTTKQHQNKDTSKEENIDKRDRVSILHG